MGQGLVAGLLALGALAGLYHYLRMAVPELKLAAWSLPLLYLGGALVALGVAVNLLSHYVVVRRYLRLRLDELY